MEGPDKFEQTGQARTNFSRLGAAQTRQVEYAMVGPYVSLLVDGIFDTK